MGILIVIGLILIWFIYESSYYKSDAFISIKNNIKDYTNKCNELNKHIEDLKNTYIGMKSIDYGKANYSDSSSFNYKRPELKKIREAVNIHNCSRTVCESAKQQPFKYLCKYFDIKENEEFLIQFENLLNNFSAAEEGKIVLKNERAKILNGISDQIPFLIKTFSNNKLIRNLGFDDIDFSQLYFPKYSFQYVSSGGYSSFSCDVVFDINNLEKFINYLADKIKFKKSVAGQRALMTLSLREKIKGRDNYSCKKCALSIRQEPNLLLEIDHIIPVSKGGLTSEENLQTLCWKCNRKKGTKID